MKSLLRKLVTWSRSAKYRRFWSDNCDRRHMAETVYPALGRWLSQRECPKILEVGCRWYTAQVRRLLAVPSDLDHWCVDPAGAPWNLETDHFVQASFLGLETKLPDLIGTFDAIVSFGLLGYWPFTRQEVQSYLATLDQLLKPDGVLFWKIDEVQMSQLETCYQFPWTDALEFFVLTSLPGLAPSALVEGNQERYHFRTLRKK